MPLDIAQGKSVYSLCSFTTGPVSASHEPHCNVDVPPNDPCKLGGGLTQTVGLATGASKDLLVAWFLEDGSSFDRRLEETVTNGMDACIYDTQLPVVIVDILVCLQAEMSAAQYAPRALFVSAAVDLGFSAWFGNAYDFSAPAGPALHHDDHWQTLEPGPKLTVIVMP